MRSPLRRFLLDPLEAGLLGVFFAVMWLLPLDLASAIGGFFGRSIGPSIKTSRIARRNLKRAFPEKSDTEIEALVRAVWDNLGRTMCELPHLRRIARSRVTVTGLDHVRSMIEDGEAGILFSGHLGNWEAFGACALEYGLPLHLVYRAPNNPLVDRLLNFARRHAARKMLPKGAQGARDILGALKRGEHLGMLVDQKMNDGIAAPFFGREAMTAPAMAQLALRFNCRVMPARMARRRGAHFDLTVEEPFRLQPGTDRSADILAATTLANTYLERWIRADPGQWLWLHRRWPD